MLSLLGQQEGKHPPGDGPFDMDQALLTWVLPGIFNGRIVKEAAIP